MGRASAANPSPTRAVPGSRTPSSNGAGSSSRQSSQSPQGQRRLRARLRVRRHAHWHSASTGDNRERVPLDEIRPLDAADPSEALRKGTNAAADETDDDDEEQHVDSTHIRTRDSISRAESLSSPRDDDERRTKSRRISFVETQSGG